MRSSDLVFPDRICNVPETAADIVRDGPDAIIADADLRPIDAIVDQVDLHLRLHWAAREAGRQHQEPPRGLLDSVLQERRHALNWLVRFEDADWDDVTTPT